MQIVAYAGASGTVLATLDQAFSKVQGLTVAD
jgi:hypothetical protein